MATTPTLTVFNFETNTSEQVPEEQVRDYILTGKYGLPKDVAVPVISPDGTPGTVSAQEAFQAFQSGFSYEPSQAREQRLREKEAQSRTGTAIAEATARGLTLGVSDPVLTDVFGVDPKDLKARKDSLAEFGTLTEVAASTVPFLFTGGTGAAAKVGVTGAKSLVPTAAKVGRKVAAEVVTPSAARASVLLKAQKGLALTEAELKVLTSQERELLTDASKYLLPESQAAEIVGAETADLALRGATDLTTQAQKSLAEKARAELAAKASAEKSLIPLEQEAQKNLKTQLKSMLGEPENKKLAEKLSQNILSKVGRSSVEGAFFGAGELVSEEALGNAEFNAESLLMSVGTGAVLGGAVGAAFGGLEKLGPPITKAGQKASKFANRYTDPEIAGLELAGKSKSQASKIMRDNPNLAKENADFLAERLAKEEFGAVGTSKQSIADWYATAQKEAGETIGRVLDEADIALKDKNVTLIRDTFYAPIVNTVENYISRYSGSPGFEAAVSRLRKIKKGYETLKDKPTPLNLKELQKLRQDADELVNFEKRFGDRPLVQQLFSDVRSVFRKQIDGVTEVVSELGPGYANLASDLKKANRDYWVTSSFKNSASRAADTSEFLPYRDLLRAGVGYAAGGLAGLSIAAAKDLLESDLRRKFVVLRSIDKGQRQFSKRLASSLDSFAKKSGTVGKISTTKILVDSKIAYDPQTGKKPETREQGYKNVFKLIEKIKSDPQFATKRIGGAVARVAQAAPNTASAAQLTMLKAVDFLDSKMPKRATPTDVIGMLKGNVPNISDIQLAKFENYVKVIDNPLTVLEDIESKTLTRESVEALRSVYPELYSKIQQETLQKVSEDPTAFSYNDRLQLGILLNIPTDASLMPQNINALQQTFAPKEDQSSGAVNPTVAGIKGVAKAGRVQTDTQRILSKET